MNQKRDYNSLRPKGKFTSLKFGFLSMMICLGAQLAFANPETNFTVVEGDPIFQTTITGTVTDSDGVPLAGANVLVKGTTTGTQTDFDGNYTLEAESDATLVFSYLGFQTLEVPVNGNSTVNATMQEDAAALDEVIVTGYQTETKRETTAAVSIVKAEELAAIPSGNVEQQLQGRVAGVTVVTNGQPGTASQIRVRGFGAFGGNEPLYVVDGVPTLNIDFLNPDDIENTAVLKDAAAASIYGARAANGVIVYTTKQGRKGSRKAKISINIQSGVTDPNVGGSPEMLNPQDMARYTHIAYENNAAANGVPVEYTHPQYGSNPTPVLPDFLHASYTDANGDNITLNGINGTVDLAQIQASFEANPENTFLIRPNLAGTNWYKEITRIAPANRVSIGFDGGTENGRFFMGLSLQNLAGILLENEQNRYTARFNSEWDITPWLSVGENLQVTYNSVNGQQGGNGGLGISDDESEVLSAYRMPTIIPVFDELGNYASTRAAGFNNPRNPVRRLVQDRGNDNNYSVSTFGNLYASVRPADGLELRTSIGGSYFTFNSVDYNFRYLGDSEPQASFSFNEANQYGFQWIWTNTLTYEKLFGKHKIKFLGGVEAIKGADSPRTPPLGRRIQGSGINPFSTDLDFVSLQTVQSPVVQSFIFKGVNFSSLFGKLDYNFDEKYYLTGVIRRDGSSVFGENNRYGVFPAVSGAWRVIAEPFMQDQDFITDLKIRGGWGEMGNSNNVRPTNQFTLAASNLGNTFYPINGQNSGADEGFAASTIGNPDAKWETSTTLNIGFDASFFNDKLEVILDWWKKDTEDLLFEVPLAGVTGNFAAAPAVNVGSMLNRGVDVQIIGRGNFTEDLSFEVTLNNSFLKNEVVEFAPGIEFLDGGTFRGIAPTRNQVGRPLSSFFGYQVIGYFNSEQEVANSPDQDGKGLGRFRYADINGDGVITPDDRTYLGDPVAEYSGGAVLNLKYKNLTLETYWNWVTGVEIFNQSKWFRDFFGTFEGSAKGVAAFNSWTPELGNNAGAPIWESVSNLSTSGASNSWYVENGDYVRLQRLALIYSFDDKIKDALGLSKLDFGISANNIWTITNYSGLDPVVGGDADTRFGVDVGNYPVTPSYLLNLNIGL
ncbi:SusC/RagA family TonB-linked outer membrane protein [Flavobacteriaceae bacterium TP-CH-4]|uniref:SusC/RagA family TonB-linked outer membrane protein n=1 Tax=Pelagihabitans pacificus TaxID=2696054 RepID=A0A967E719_9FLAO|nr:SusC/RagA family TonB-linked outer membrane protein [Pelagihabitans pacificus]NHF61112.1 SusC/RagA family TonB-linked outer membrane protein [Pelagihabitans pacificus]